MTDTKKPKHTEQPRHPDLAAMDLVIEEALKCGMRFPEEEYTSTVGLYELAVLHLEGMAEPEPEPRMELTDLERKTLVVFQAGMDRPNLGWLHELADECPVQGKALAGVISSLVKKGVITSDDDASHEQSGMYWIKVQSPYDDGLEARAAEEVEQAEPEPSPDNPLAGTGREWTVTVPPTCGHGQPRVYVACLASYNAGSLYGKWLPATDVDELREGIAAMLEKSPEPGAEEWAAHDYDGGLSRVFKTESPDLEELCAFGAAMEELGPEADALLAWAEYSSGGTLDGRDSDEIIEAFREQYYGRHDSEKDYAEEYVEKTGLLIEFEERVLSRYFDYEAYARDLFHDYTSVEAPGHGVYVFKFNQ